MGKKCPHCDKAITGIESRDLESDLKKLAVAVIDNLQIDDDGYDWVMFGLHTKKPFGNSSVKADILEIIGWEPEDGDDYTEEQTDYANDLILKKMIPYLQKQYGSMKTGD